MKTSYYYLEESDKYSITFYGKYYNVLWDEGSYDNDCPEGEGSLWVCPTCEC